MKEMESLYGESEDAPMEAKEGAEEPKKEVEGHTELVSKKVLGIGEDEDIKPGTEFVVSLVAMHGDQAEIKYATKEKAPSKPPVMSEDDQLSAMTE